MAVATIVGVFAQFSMPKLTVPRIVVISSNYVATSHDEWPRFYVRFLTSGNIFVSRIVLPTGVGADCHNWRDATFPYAPPFRGFRVFAPNSVVRPFPFRRRFFQKRYEFLALDFLLRRQAAQAHQRRITVQRLDDAGATRAVASRARLGNDQRHARAHFKPRTGLAQASRQGRAVAAPGMHGQ